MTSATAAQLRKIKKPLIERRRRERINDCLNQLKMIVLEASQKDETRYSKMEKADILEMTVSHLRTVCRCQTTSGTSTTDPTSSTAAVGRYVAGYRQCAVEVARYLAHQAAAAAPGHRGPTPTALPPSAVDAVRARLMRHLTAVLQTKLLHPPSREHADQPTSTLMTSFPAEAEVRWRSDCSTSTCSSAGQDGMCSPEPAMPVSPAAGDAAVPGYTAAASCGVRPTAHSAVVDRLSAEAVSPGPGPGRVRGLPGDVDSLTDSCDADGRVWRPW